MPWSKKLFLGFYLCFCLTAVKAQYRIDHWTVDDGLPLNSIYSVIQTQDGYLWMATLDGLVRFDGVRFTVFNKSNSPGIANNRFISLFETAGGDLWAGTEESGAARFHGGRFEHFGAEAGVPRGVSWIESDGGGDGAIFPDLNQTVRFSDGKFSPFEAGSNFPLPARAARTSNVKISCRSNSENKFSECFVNGQWLSFSLPDGSSKEKFVSVVQEANSDRSPKVRFASAAQEPNGIVWLITADGRLARAENGKGVERHLPDVRFETD